MADGRHVILIVDDDPDLRDVLKLMLERHGYAVVQAASGEEGLRRFDEQPPDVVIVDLMMEEVDSGTLFVQALQFKGSEVPVFMLSSVGDSLHGVVNYAELGLAGLFQKPLDAEKMLAALAATLGG